MTTALGQIVANKLRSFFTLLGIIVSVAFLVAVIAIIQGMNAFVKENIADAMIGANTFQVRRTPINVGRISDDEINRINRRPKITPRDAEAVRAAIPDADAVSFQSGWPTPRVDLVWRNERVADVILFGVTEQFQIVQDYRAEEGRSLSDVDVAQRRAVIVIGRDIADALFPNLTAVGKTVRILGEQFEVIGVNAGKGQVLGQSFDTYALMPSTRFEMLFGRRSTTVISVKMAEADAVEPAMQRAEEAMRVARGLRPGDDNDFSIETSDALVAFWKTVTRLLFAIIPAVVAIGVVVGGIVIMNIMLMAVTERTHEIGIRKAVGARAEDIERQFLGEAVVLATLGGVIGVSAGWLFALAIAAASPLPARVTAWSVLLSLALGAGVGILFGVYPARRAARLDPIAALRAE
ncbi:MAG: ABC transporter permease [Gemmatimonadetes bacterium]|nr:ABC transporter permease [Gemmatimonadota bacterium]MBK6844397.1 ABC transporter permease [Gemmatimonadota bacterium]MBK8648773.1 ABC transporter permease [Gemmatimonadota bacterium]